MRPLPLSGPLSAAAEEARGNFGRYAKTVETWDALTRRYVWRSFREMCPPGYFTGPLYELLVRRLAGYTEGDASFDSYFALCLPAHVIAATFFRYEAERFDVGAYNRQRRKKGLPDFDARRTRFGRGEETPYDSRHESRLADADHAEFALSLASPGEARLLLRLADSTPTEVAREDGETREAVSTRATRVRRKISRRAESTFRKTP